jgi:hypothetical protein
LNQVAKARGLKPLMRRVKCRRIIKVWVFDCGF